VTDINPFILDDVVPQTVPQSAELCGTYENMLARLYEATGSKKQNDLAQGLGINAQAVNNALRKEKIPLSWLYNLAIEHKISLNWLAFGIGPKTLSESENNPLKMDLVMIPTADITPAAENKFHINSSMLRKPFLKKWADKRGDPKDLILVRAITNIMEPTIQQGDLALINARLREPVSGKVYAVSFQGLIHLYRVFWEDDCMRLTGDSIGGKPPLETIVKAQDAPGFGVHILGRALWWEHSEEPVRVFATLSTS